MKKADRPDWQRYQEALAALDQGRGREAAQALEALARRGYVRAQYTLAGLYATGRGVLKDPQRATHWLAQAAARGHAHALNELAARHLDGRGVPQDVQKALDRLSFRAPAQLSFRAQREILVLHPAIRLLPAAPTRNETKNPPRSGTTRQGCCPSKIATSKVRRAHSWRSTPCRPTIRCPASCWKRNPGWPGVELRGFDIGQQWCDLQRRQGNGLPRVQRRGGGQDRGGGEAGEVGGGVRESCPFRRR